MIRLTIAVIEVEPAVKYSFVYKGIQTRWMGQYKAELTLSPRLYVKPLIIAITAIIDLITVLEAILTGRQHASEITIQCLYGNPMANNFLKTWILNNLWILAREQAHLWVTRASGEERVGQRSDPAGWSLVKRRQESECFHDVWK